MRPKKPETTRSNDLFRARPTALEMGKDYAERPWINTIRPNTMLKVLGNNPGLGIMAQRVQRDALGQTADFTAERQAVCNTVGSIG